MQYDIQKSALSLRKHAGTSHQKGHEAGAEDAYHLSSVHGEIIDDSEAFMKTDHAAPSRISRREFSRLLAAGGSLLLPRDLSAWPAPLAQTPARPDERFWLSVREQFLIPANLGVMNAANTRMATMA